MTNEKKSIGKATRPIFIPNREALGVKTLDITFDWHLGMSAAVKKRSILSLHQCAREKGYDKILEASSKSDNHIGIKLSAFFLKDKKGYPVENLFQSSKKFDKGGPFNLLSVSPKEAKTDPRLKNSGDLIDFVWDDKSFPLEPKSLFYDWLYMKTLEENHNFTLKNMLLESKFNAFSDIEFNPKKSFSCQARTLAIYITLVENEVIKEFIEKPDQIANEYKLYENILYALDKNKDVQGKENVEQLGLFS